jgi:hypothetical protein
MHGMAARYRTQSLDEAIAVANESPNSIPTTCGLPAVRPMQKSRGFPRPKPESGKAEIFRWKLSVEESALALQLLAGS